MKALPLAICFFPWLWLSCAASGNSNAQHWEQKIDPRLRAEMQSPQAQGAGPEAFPVMIKFKTALSAEQRGELEKAGVRLLSPTGDIATARLSTQAISELAKKDYVIYLEASKDRSLHP